MKVAFENIPAFADGVICALDDRLLVSEDKELDWSIAKHPQKNYWVLEFTYTTGYEIESEEPIHEYETLYLDETDGSEKIVRDITDIMERINNADFENRSRKELLADKYFD